MILHNYTKKEKFVIYIISENKSNIDSWIITQLSGNYKIDCFDYSDSFKSLNKNDKLLLIFVYFKNNLESKDFLFLKKLSQIFLFKNINKIAIMPSDCVITKHKVLEIDNYEIITKPVSIEELKKRVAFYTELNRTLHKTRNLYQEQSSSIQYASKIQNVIIPTRQEFDQLIKENFIFFKPKDIVSGDFYWFRHINGKTVVLVADCTGHGVPGAFMSVLGINFINEIIVNQGILESDVILNILREKIILSLKQSYSVNSTNDGMDIALCIIDRDYEYLQFSGAFNPLIIVRDDQVIEYKGDRMPVGLYSPEVNDFKKYIIEYSKGDQFYLFSDGFSDQFGGEKGHKFRYKQFLNLLFSIRKNKMKNQGMILEDNFVSWKNGYEQMDDVCVVGFKL